MEKTAIVQKMNEAITAGDAEQFQAAFVELCDKIQESVIEQARGIVEEADQRILSERGVRQLTSKEKEYYQKLAEAMKAPNPKQAVENLDVVMPYTVIDKVFEDLKTDHPLLSKIQFTSVIFANFISISPLFYCNMIQYKNKQPNKGGHTI